MKIYEVELIRKDKKSGAIIYSNSWGKESLWTYNKKEAIDLKNDYLEDVKVIKDYDAVLINVVIYPDNTVSIVDNKLINDDDVDCIECDCLCEIDTKRTRR